MTTLLRALASVALICPFVAASPLPTDSMASADLAFQQRGEPSKAFEALTAYRAVTQRTPHNPEAQWRLSMADYFVGFRLTPTRKEKLNLFEEGQRAGETSLSLNPSCAPCHFWTAVNMALFGETAGILKMLFTLGEIRHHLELSAKLDPNYAHAGSYRILAKIDESLPGILGGSRQRAKDYLEKAVALSPSDPLNYLFLAQHYRDVLGNKPMALATAKQGVTLPLPAPEWVEEREALSDLRALIESLENKPD